MTAARRLATILGADVVGYSHLMGEDEAWKGRANLASLKSGMLACSYPHGSTMAMVAPGDCVPSRSRSASRLCRTPRTPSSVRFASAAVGGRRDLAAAF